ncbi:MAG TPA: ketopantoate reductase C-terminal domain-containing protein [Gemmataceae bacterium]|nr:ketopantoate reductase C-terminal domain-containing protein [Gemmataceae bacterium]
MDALTVVGAGGIGCAVGYCLAAAGVRVTFVDADPDKVRDGRRHGVRVDRLPPQPAAFVPFADWSPAADDVVLLCTKCYDNAAVLARLPASVALLPIQNGFDPALAAPGGAEGIASFVSECLPHVPHTRITRRGKLHLGLRGPEGGLRSMPYESRAGHAPQARPSVIAALLRRTPLFRVVEVPDILPYKHTKLMYNAAISPLAAAAGLDNGQLLSVPPARRLFFALLRENHAVLTGAGVALGKVGPFHPATVQRILRRPLVARCLAWAFEPTLRGTYCSMSGDLPRGRTEIDYYNGHLIRLAAGRPCPLNRLVYDLVKRMERERLPPAVEVLGALAAA